ncbi:MAG: BON domain-containing protein [Planctomycetaceae bacterium]
MQQLETRTNGFGTDHDLRERIGQALQDSGYPRLRSLTVDVEGGSVVLRGRVPSYYFKQVAQTVAMNAARPATLRNDLDVA